MIPTAPAFFATPSTVAEVAGARAVAVLIGGYDGSGNYGDLAQLDAALALLGHLEPDVLVLPVLERVHLGQHDALRADFLHPPERALFFDPGEGHEDGLLPVPAPAELAFAACYLYGGGYLNPSWGERKLAMLRAAESLLAAGGAAVACRLSTGLQVDGGWIADLAAEDAELLRRFEPLGARDPASAEALAALGSASTVLDTGDDAVGVLRRLAPGDTAAPEGRLRVNVHLAEHEWVTGVPAAMAGFYADFVAELGRRAGLPVVAHPFIAYLDGRVDERPAIGRLAEACAARGVELAEPRVLRPASLGPALDELRRGSLTLSCSYHVALTSLLQGVPAILLRDNPYYEQKAAGLAESFGLPGPFALGPSSDPTAAAQGIAAIVLDEQGAGALRERLAAGASRMRERRANAEVELLGRLSGGVAAAMAQRVGELSERLRERSAEPAELLARLSLLQSENGSLPPVPDAEDSAAQEALTVVLESRSWKMTAPLRRLGSLRRRQR